MAKRFIDTNFFKDPFVRGLQGACKGLYIYLFLECNNVGIWQKELDIAKLRCGISDDVEDSEILKIFKNKIIEFDNGEKWFIVNFIKIQHGGVLNENNKAHKNFLPELITNKFVISTENGAYTVNYEFLNNLIKINNQGATQGAIQAPSQGAKVMVMVKEEGNGIGNGKKEKKENLIFPFETETFFSQWALWKLYKEKEFKFKYKTTLSEQAALKELSELSQNIEKTAINIIHQSMANGWKGFFALKEQTISKQTNHVEQMKKANSMANQFYNG